MKNTYKFHCVSKFASRIFQRIYFFIDTTQPISTFQRIYFYIDTTQPISTFQRIYFYIDTTQPISTSDQRCFNIVDHCWNNIDPTLKLQQNLKSHFQRCTTLIQRRCPTLKSTLRNVEATVFQRCTTSFQPWYDS